MEAASELKNVKGKMTLMLKHLKNNTSPAQYSLAGIQINNGLVFSLEESMLSKTIDGLPNSSLKCLVMNRKRLTDL
jgi:hypothetical protein